MAVSPDGMVYGVAQPNAWPWQITYEVLIRTSVDTWAIVQLRLQRTVDGRAAVRVWASAANEHGYPVRDGGTTRGGALIPLKDDDALQGACALFWVHSWSGLCMSPRAGGQSWEFCITFKHSQTTSTVCSARCAIFTSTQSTRRSSSSPQCCRLGLERV